MLRNDNQSSCETSYELSDAINLTMITVYNREAAFLISKLTEKLDTIICHTSFNRHIPLIEKGRISQLLHLLCR